MVSSPSVSYATACKPFTHEAFSSIEETFFITLSSKTTLPYRIISVLNTILVKYTNNLVSLIIYLIYCQKKISSERVLLPFFITLLIFKDESTYPSFASELAEGTVIVARALLIATKFAFLVALMIRNQSTIVQIPKVNHAKRSFATPNPMCPM